MSRLYVGDIVPLACQLEDGATQMFVRAFLRDSADTSLATIDLTHIAFGYYKSTAQVLPNIDFIQATYVVYTNSARSTESAAHLRSIDVWSVGTIASAAFAATGITRIQNGLADATTASAILASATTIQSKLPTVLVGGRMDSSVGAMAATTITSAAFAADAITRIQNGLAGATTSSAILASTASILASTASVLVSAASIQTSAASIQAGITNIQTRIPAALVGGRIDASVGAMANGTITSAAFAADAITRIQNGLAGATTSSAILALATSIQTDTDDIQDRLTAIQADTDNIQTRLPDELSRDGYMKSDVFFMETNVLTADALATDAVSEIQNGLALSSETQDIQSRLPAALVGGRMDSSVGAMANGTITSAAFAQNGIDRIQSGLAGATTSSAILASTVTIQSKLPALLVGGRIDASVGAIADVTITSAAFAASAITRIQSGLAGATTSSAILAAVASAQFDIDDIQARLPAALVGGRMDSSVGAIADSAITSAAFAANAITRIQAGLMTSSQYAALQSDTDDIQTRLPAALVSGRMDSSVGAIADTTITSAAFAANAITRIQNGLAAATTSSAILASVASVQFDVDDIQARLPASLVSGRIDASVGAVAAGALTSAAFAQNGIDRIADQIWDESLSGHTAEGSVGRSQIAAAGFGGLNAFMDNITNDSSNNLVAGRLRIFATAAQQAAATAGGTGEGELLTISVTTASYTTAASTALIQVLSTLRRSGA